MRLFQYWDQPQPPPEVSAWIEGFRCGNPGFRHVLFDHATAAEFIDRHYGARETAAFQACAVPAMQADYVRLCAIAAFGGVYVDADNQCLAPLSGLLDRAPDAMVLSWGALLNNGFLMFRRPHDPFIRACLALATANVEARRFDIGFMSTGPGVINAVRALVEPEALPAILADFDNPTCARWGFPELLEHARNLICPTPELEESFRAITRLNALAATPWLGGEQPAYKSTDRHWLNWKGSIYRDGG